MKTSTTGPAKGQPPGRQPQPLAAAIRESTRLEVVSITVILFVYALATVTLLTS